MSVYTTKLLETTLERGFDRAIDTAKTDETGNADKNWTGYGQKQ
jgi:hypothetical protein